MYSTADTVNGLNAAIGDFNSMTCIRMIPRTTETNYINIISDDGCYSYIGMIGGAQNVRHIPVVQTSHPFYNEICVKAKIYMKISSSIMMLTRSRNGKMLSNLSICSLCLIASTVIQSHGL